LGRNHRRVLCLFLFGIDFGRTVRQAIQAVKEIEGSQGQTVGLDLKFVIANL
jgi:hypothetical protein